jgi:large subunit ribosomal protein L25
VVVSVEGLEAGTQVLASQLSLPEGAALITDGDALVVNITQQISAEALEAELAEAEAEAGIEHEAPEGPLPTEGEAPTGEATAETSDEGGSDDS